jgi:threo-3-hydroxy-L-aspartate ammonia-lyase
VDPPGPGSTTVLGPPLDLERVRAAAGRLAGVAHRTPVFASRTLDRLTGGTVLLKMESLQRAGSFKFRGAYSRIALLSAKELGRGVVAYSSGNHAQAVALAASILGAPSVIVMPGDAPPEKAEAARGYGAEVVTYDRYTQDRAAIGAALAEERGLTLVPPYDDVEVMAGQGTAALELVEEAGPLDVLVAPVSGGGLIAGCATVVKALQREARAIGVEPEAGDDTRRSMAEGRRVRLDGVPRTIADGLQVDTPGELTFPINLGLVDGVVTVSDAELVGAMTFLFERMKAVVEPSGAAGVAALLAGRVPDVAGRRVGVIVSGGNVSARRFADLVQGR